jgi:hypothetical protein
MTLEEAQAEIAALKEKLIEVGRESMSRSAVIDYLRAENRQLKDVLGVDDNTKDFGAGEKLRLLRVALKQSEEEIERLKEGCRRTYEELTKAGLDIDFYPDGAQIGWTGKWFDPNSCLASRLYMVASAIEVATEVPMNSKPDDSYIWIEDLVGKLKKEDIE